MMGKKLLAMIFAALMVSSAAVGLTSCADNGDQKATEGATKDPLQTEPTTSEVLKPEVPFDLCPNTEITFLTRGGTDEWHTVDICSAGVTGDVIGDAVWERNSRIQNDYQVTILDLPSETISDAVNKEIASSSGSFQAIVTKLGETAPMASAGQIFDLTDTEYIDFTKPWWDSQAVAGLSIGGRVFFATGDLLTSDNDGTFILMFNKKMVADNNLENIYELVTNGQWTLDKMFTMEKLVTNDTNGNGVLEFDQDVIGFANTGNVPFSMFYGIGVTSCLKDSDDMPYFALDTGKLADNVQMLYNICGNKSYAANMELGGDGVQANGKKCFGEGHALFFGECMQCITRLRGYSTTFGVVPYPKANEEQDRYYCHMNEIGGMVAIPKTAENQLDAVSGIIEAMAAYSMTTLTPAYYDRSLIGQGTRDEESEPMIRLILESRIYDLGYVYGWGGLVDQVRSIVSTGSNTASKLTTRKKAYETAMNTTLKNFDLD